ncbi:MAG: hypothetical protein KGI80_02220 [Verrucomicrobiota bacterium]|nr:hypothetical protein [Verrucomicrobiota bacterium]
MKKIIDILLDWPKPYIFGSDLCHLLNKSPDSRYAIVKRALKEGLLLPLRRDLYLIRRKSSLVDTFEISSILYGPSYVSFESALSYHGWIPEAVRSTTCASTKRSKEFETSLGFFSYEHIPSTAFPLGVEQHQKRNVTLFIAHPWKALADMIYARKQTWTTLNDLSEDLRIDPEHFTDSDASFLADLSAHYPNNLVKRTLGTLRKSLPRQRDLS